MHNVPCPAMLRCGRDLASLPTLSIPRPAHHPHSHQRKPAESKLNGSRRELHLAASDARVESRLAQRPTMIEHFKTCVKITLGLLSQLGFDSDSVMRHGRFANDAGHKLKFLTRSQSAFTPSTNHQFITPGDVSSAYFLPRIAFRRTQKVTPARAHKLPYTTMPPTCTGPCSAAQIGAHRFR